MKCVELKEMIGQDIAVFSSDSGYTMGKLIELNDHGQAIVKLVGGHSSFPVPCHDVVHPDSLPDDVTDAMALEIELDEMDDNPNSVEGDFPFPDEYLEDDDIEF